MNYPTPLVLKCTVTGAEITYTDPEYIKQRVDAAGGLDQLRATYVSKAGKRQLKATSPAKDERPSRMWKGEAILKPAPSPVAVAQPTEKPDTINRLFIFEDGGISFVSHPRQNPDQKIFTLHDHRRNKADIHWTQKDRYYAPFFAAA